VEGVPRWRYRTDPTPVGARSVVQIRPSPSKFRLLSTSLMQRPTVDYSASPVIQSAPKPPQSLMPFGKFTDRIPAEIRLRREPARRRGKPHLPRPVPAGAGPHFVTPRRTRRVRRGFRLRGEARRSQGSPTQPDSGRFSGYTEFPNGITAKLPSGTLMCCWTESASQMAAQPRGSRLSAQASGPDQSKPMCLLERPVRSHLKPKASAVSVVAFP
jgi:hypothetical protein